MMPPEMVADSLARWASEECHARVEVRWIGLSTDVPSGLDLRWEGDPCRDRPTVHLTVVDPSGPIWMGRLSPRLDGWITGPVSPTDVARGASFVPAVGEVDWNEPIASCNPCVALVDLRAGQTVRADRAADQPQAASGTSVSIVARSGRAEVRASGRLLEDGRVGESVRVVNDVTGVQQRGVLVDEKTVEIR